MAPSLGCSVSDTSRSPREGVRESFIAVVYPKRRRSDSLLLCVFERGGGVRETWPSAFHLSCCVCPNTMSYGRVRACPIWPCSWNVRNPVAPPLKGAGRGPYRGGWLAVHSWHHGTNQCLIF
jgi:hypothetical protein